MKPRRYGTKQRTLQDRKTECALRICNTAPHLRANLTAESLARSYGLERHVAWIEGKLRECAVNG